MGVECGVDGCSDVLGCSCSRTLDRKVYECVRVISYGWGWNMESVGDLGEVGVLSSFFRSDDLVGRMYECCCPLSRVRRADG